MKPKVVVYRKIEDEVLDYLKKECEVKYFGDLEKESIPKFYEEIKDAQGILGSAVVHWDSEMLDKAPELKIHACKSVGYDYIDVEEFNKRGIMATNTPGVLNATVADTVFALIMTTARRITELDQMVKKGNWTKMINEQQFGVDVHHKTLGIIGMGRIGYEVVKRAHCGFDMNILYNDLYRNEHAENDFNANYCELDELLSTSDFVCIMLPATPETKHMMSEREFSLMKKSAIFINGSRGQNVDEKALIKALENGEIRAAGLDVFEVEPVAKENALLKMSNVVTLPHIGSATGECRQQMNMLAAENLIKGLKGLTPPNLITKK